MLCCVSLVFFTLVESPPHTHRLWQKHSHMSGAVNLPRNTLSWDCWEMNVLPFHIVGVSFVVVFFFIFVWRNVRFKQTFDPACRRPDVNALRGGRAPVGCSFLGDRRTVGCSLKYSLPPCSLFDTSKESFLSFCHRTLRCPGGRKEPVTQSTLSWQNEFYKNRRADRSALPDSRQTAHHLML